MSQPIILALDTSTQACSVAINDVQGQMFYQDTLTPQSHANQILEMIQTLMSEAKVKSDDIDYLAYGQGPGAFTGIRIAAGVIQGLALGWEKPVIGLSSLSSIAKSTIQQNQQQLQSYDYIEWLTLVDARMKEVYWQNGVQSSTDNWQESEIEMLPAGDFLTKLDATLDTFQKQSHQASAKKALVICGDIEKEYPQAVEMIKSHASQNSDVYWYSGLPSAQAMIELAQNKLTQARTIDEELPKPLYLRNHVADTIAEREAKKMANQNKV